MKRCYVTIGLISLMLLLGACEENESTDNSIAETELTGREEAILSATTDKSFVFDFTVDPTYKQLSVWVDKYELGKLVDEEIGHVNSDIIESGQIVFSTLDSHDDTNQSLFNASILDEGGSSRISFLAEVPKDYSSTWGNNDMAEISIAPTNEIVLASINYSNKSSMSSLSSDFYNDMDSHIDEIKDYDIVYLLKGKFIK